MSVDDVLLMETVCDKLKLFYQFNVIVQILQWLQTNTQYVPGSTAEKVGWLKFDCAHSELVALGHVVPLLIILEFFFFFFYFLHGNSEVICEVKYKVEKNIFLFYISKIWNRPTASIQRTWSWTKLNRLKSSTGGVSHFHFPPPSCAVNCMFF